MSEDDRNDRDPFPEEQGRPHTAGPGANTGPAPSAGAKMGATSHVAAFPPEHPADPFPGERQEPSDLVEPATDGEPWAARALERCRAAMGRQPLAAALVALGAGVLAGRLLRRRAE